MKVFPNKLYLISNFSNQKQTIFHQHFDFFIFTKLINKYLRPYCDIHAYIIIPNHFQLLITVNEKGAQPYFLGKVKASRFTNSLRLLQANYARYRNRQHNLSGSAFKQKPKIYNLENSSLIHLYLDQLHQCPAVTGLVKNIDEWTFSSIHDFMDKKLPYVFIELVDLPKFNTNNISHYTTLSAHEDEAKASGLALNV